MRRLFDAVMFDLDGTLLDTLADIAAAGNHVLTQLGRSPLRVDKYRFLAGQGAPWLIQNALGVEREHLWDRALALFKSYQLEHGLDQTRPYPGVEELLDELSGGGVRMAVLSNKPDAAAQLAVSRCLSRWRFDVVLGHRDGAAAKPDPGGALRIAEELSIEPRRWLYLGDTRVDMQTATAAGMYAVGALWGFRDETELRESGARALLKHPCELPPLLGPRE